MRSMLQYLAATATHVCAVYFSGIEQHGHISAVLHVSEH
jgi:hypothetical protein